MRQSTVLLLVSFLICLFTAERARGQLTVTALQLGVPVERSIGPRQSHGYTVTLEEHHHLQLVVSQHGIDLVVRIVSPTRKLLGEFDSPNGSEGPENVSFVAAAAGVYSIVVAPLDRSGTAPAGRYEIKVVEMRQATEQELETIRNQEALKAKGLALVAEVADSIPGLLSEQARVRAQLQVAGLLWDTNEKLASKLTADAIAVLKEYLATTDLADPDNYQNYLWAMQLRLEAVQALAAHDPDLALSFLRSTRALANPEGSQRQQAAQEAQFELSIANQITAKDPKRAFQMAQDSLKNGFSSNLIQTLSRLRGASPELAVRLASDIATKLQGEKLLKNPAAAEVALDLIRVARTPAQRAQVVGERLPQDRPILSDQEYRDLVQKAISEVLAYAPPAGSVYSPERNNAQNLLNTLKSMGPDLEAQLPGGAAAIEKRLMELNSSMDPNAAAWQRYQSVLNNSSMDSALQAIPQAPAEIRERLYQELADKAAVSGDLVAARKLLTDHIANPFQRQQALQSLELQSIHREVANGRIEEALKRVASLRSKARAMILSQIANQIGPGQKRVAALNLLETTCGMLGTSLQAEGQEHLNALLEIAKSFSRYDSKRAFEIVEPLVDQFNDISAAARTLNGFGQEYFQNGELIMQNGNAVAAIANQLIATLNALSAVNFDRAKALSDRIQQPEVRIRAYLSIAQWVIRAAD